MLKKEIMKKLREDSVFLTRVSAELGKPFPTVKSWVQRDSSRLCEYPVLEVLGKLLNKEICEIIK